MKIFKQIKVSSDGSIFFANSFEIASQVNPIMFQKKDEKSFNQKITKLSLNLQSSSYKKKYLN